MQSLPRFRATDSYMADSIGSSLANILAYIWTFLLTFFVGQTTSNQTELPLRATKGSSGSQVQQTQKSSEFMMGSEKEQFLRHPSLGSTRKGRQKDSEVRGKRHRSPSMFPTRSSIQYFNSFVHRPRSRADPTATVPVVIVTPSTPKSKMFLLPELLLPSLSTPLELSDATVEPSHQPPISETLSVPEDIDEMSSTLEKQISVLSDIENNISDVEFDSWIISAAQPSLEKETADSSFFLPESLQKITFEPIRRASHALSALSAVSNIFYDVPIWSGVEAPNAGKPAYFTSTPPRQHQSVGSKVRDIENNYVDAIDSPSHDSFYQYIPYPDVFDLDMYFDATIALRKKLRKTQHRECTVRNPPSLESDSLTDPPCERLPSDGCKERSRPRSFVVPSSSPVTYHECQRVCRDNIHQSPSTRSSLENISTPVSPLSSILPRPQQQHRIPQHSYSNPRYITPLDESTNTFFRSPSTTNATTSSSSTFYSAETSTRTQKSQCEPNHSVPASPHSPGSRSGPRCQQPRTSSDSELESDAGSMDAVNARLREAYDGFSTPTYIEEMEIWEPVPF